MPSRQDAKVGRRKSDSWLLCIPLASWHLGVHLIAMRIIDFHTHLDDFWFSTPLLSCDEFVAGIDRCGIEIACVFTLRGFYEDCRIHNDKLLERASRLPKRLLPF